MEKPRIVIADTDMNYIALIQALFINKFYDKIDLEIITDKNYCENFFSAPQNIDVFIVSEDLYNSSVKRHNIKKLFVMTEKKEEYFDSNINKVYKYSSMGEILNNILSSSADILAVINEEVAGQKIVLVTSAAGGVGKTTVAMGLAACLSRRNRKVLYLDSNKLHTFQYKLKNKAPILRVDTYLKMMTTENIYNDIKHEIRNEIFDYLPPFKSSLISLGIKFDIFSKIAYEAKKSKEYDYIIIDTDSVFDEEKTELLKNADKVIVVTKQNNASIAATNELIKNINGINSEKYKFICNDYINSIVSDHISPEYSIDDYIEHIEQYERLEIRDFIDINGMQKAIYLLF